MFPQYLKQASERLDGERPFTPPHLWEAHGRLCFLQKTSTPMQGLEVFVRGVEKSEVETRDLQKQRA